MEQTQPPLARELDLPKVYRPRAFNLPGGFLLTAVAIGLLVFGCQARGVLIWLGIAGGIVLPFALFILIFGLLHRTKCAVIAKDAFTYTDGKSRVDWPWEEIESVTFAQVPTQTLGLPTGTDYRYVLQHQNGQQITIDNRLHGYSELGEQLQAFIAHHRRPSVITRFRNAQVISFGDYAVDQEALWHDSQRIPWPEIDHIDLKQSGLYIYRHGQPTPSDFIPVFQLPNMLILLEIIHAMAGIQEHTVSQSLSD